MNQIRCIVQWLLILFFSLSFSLLRAFFSSPLKVAVFSRKMLKCQQTHYGSRGKEQRTVKENVMRWDTLRVNVATLRGDVPMRKDFFFLLLSFAKATQNKRLSESSNGRISSAKPSQVKAQSVRQTQTLRNRHHCCSGSVVHSVQISDHVRLRINVITEMPRIWDKIGELKKWSSNLFALFALGVFATVFPLFWVYFHHCLLTWWYILRPFGVVINL